MNNKQVWTTLDPSMSIFPRNAIFYPDLIEGYFVRPQLHLLKQNIRLPREEQTHHIQAFIIKSVLSISTFCKSLYNRGIFINITTEKLNHLHTKVQELCTSLKQHIGQRVKVVSKINLESLLTTDQFQKYGKSNHVQCVNEILKNAIISAKDLIKTNKQQSVVIRDYLMISLAYFNCFNCPGVSNLMNISLENSAKTQKHEERDDA